MDYADALSTTYATMVSERLLEHFAGHGLPLDSMIFSTDNGCEYGGGEKELRKIGYHASMQRLGVSHRFLPPATPNAHADIESSQASIENEFFDLERFTSRENFFEKVTTYQLCWNFARPNYSKGKRTPAEILQAEGIDPRVLLVTPTDLGAMFRKKNNTCQVGQHLAVDTVTGNNESPKHSPWH